MARRNIDTMELPDLIGGIDYDSDPFAVPKDCLINASNLLPSLSVGALTVINGFTSQNPNSILNSNYMQDSDGNLAQDSSGNKAKSG